MFGAWHISNLFLKDNKEIKSYRGAINSNNNIERCSKIRNSCQVFEIEALCESQYVYLYHLEIDGFGIICEKLFYNMIFIIMHLSAP